MSDGSLNVKDTGPKTLGVASDWRSRSLRNEYE
jgi:hypothetical protein